MPKYNTTIEKYQGKLPKNKSWKYVKMIRGHNVIDVTRMTITPKNHTKKISKNSYVYIKTGEVKNYMPKVDGNQMRNRRSLRKIFRDLRQLIETNFQGGPNNKFLTLTYREQTNDNKQLLNDLDLFNKRMKYNFPGMGYIHIVEPHASGNWHIHSLYKRMDGSAIDFMDYDRLRALWGHGNVHVEELNNVSNIGAYFIAYFSNMEIADEDLHKYPDDIKQMPRQDGNGFKNVIKGKRMDFYPDWMKIYRSSTNLKKPTSIKNIPDGFEKTFEETYKMAATDEDGNTGEVYLRNEQHNPVT